jgi:hypothetical protein
MTTSRQRGIGLAFSVKDILFLGQLSDCQLSASHEKPRSMKLTCNQLNPINCFIVQIHKLQLHVGATNFSQFRGIASRCIGHTSCRCGHTNTTGVPQVSHLSGVHGYVSKLEFHCL